MALDKTNDYHFVYYNRVIKPALVGLAGPWISGGIEFNWPQHHRPSTFHPVDVDIVAGDDGIVDRVVQRDRPHGRYAGHARLHAVSRQGVSRNSRAACRIARRCRKHFLWWANPAVHVDENHQSIFPPDVCAVMDHGKRDVSTFPIATGEYYKVDYSPGTDISRYKNIPVPTSYMAYHSDYNFVGLVRPRSAGRFAARGQPSCFARQEAVDVGLRRLRPGMGSPTDGRRWSVRRVDVRRVHRQSARLQLAEVRAKKNRSRSSSCHTRASASSRTRRSTRSLGSTSKDRVRWCGFTSQPNNLSARVVLTARE